MSAYTIISVRHLEKTYNSGEVKVQALIDINLEVNREEFVAIMGPSGSGKSTLMNILGCLDTATGGEYYLDGVNVRENTPNQLAELRNRKIGFIFQAYNLLPRTSAVENVELPLLYNAKVDNKERRERALQALKSVGLADRVMAFPNQLSGGQQQRVAIARAIVTEPVLILADEPTGNLDTRTSFEIMDIFQRMNEQGKTIVVVTHEPDIASFTKRNVQFRDGRIDKDIVLTTFKNARKELSRLPSLNTAKAS